MVHNISPSLHPINQPLHPGKVPVGHALAANKGHKAHPLDHRGESQHLEQCTRQLQMDAGRQPQSRLGENLG